MLWSTTLASLVLLVATTDEGAAHPPVDVVVLAPTTTGDIDASTRTLLTDALVRGLTRAGQSTVVSSRPDPCPDTTCIEQQLRATGAAHAVVATFAADGRDYTIELGLRHADSVDRVLKVDDQCELCGISEVTTRVEDVAAGLAQDVLDRERPARIFVSSDPPGATVLLDDIEFGVTPFQAEVDPGPHALDFVLPGYIDRARNVVAAEGGLTRVEERLQPVPESMRPNNGLHLAGGILDGLGVAGVGAGVTLLVLHHRPYGPSCDGPRDPFTGRCRQRYDTVAAGAATLTAGVVGLATGIALHVLAARRRGKTRRRRADD